MKSTKIIPPKGWEINRDKSSLDEIIFKEIEKELPTSWEELKLTSGWFISSLSGIIEITGKEDIRQTHNKNIFRTKEQAKACLAKAQLSQLLYIYNEGWTPDWSNRDSKFVLFTVNGEIEIDLVWHVEYFLAFKTSKIRDEFLESFKDLILQASHL